MKLVHLPEMPRGQKESWQEFLTFARIFPNHWTLIGGQLTHLHSWERGTQGSRATTDIDTVIDIKTEPEGLQKVTQVLVDLGFAPIPETSSGHQISWVKGDAQIDLLIARGVGSRAEAKIGVGGASTISTAGGQEAINHSEKIIVSMDDVETVINRPSLVGALIIKAEAARNTSDLNRFRHIDDLATLIKLYDIIDSLEVLSSKEKTKIQSGIAFVEKSVTEFQDIDELQIAIERIKLGLADSD